MTLTSVLFLPLTLGLFLFDVVTRDHQNRLLDCSRAWCRLLFASNPFWRIEVSGIANLKTGGPFVIVANHQSLGDILAAIMLPVRMRFVGKWVVFAFVPLWGWQAWLHGHLPIRRGSRASGGRLLDRAARVLALGQSVLFFPEGTRSETGEVGRFKSGAFRIALRTRASLLPVVLAGTADAVPKGSLRFGRRAFVRVDVLPPVPTEGLDADDPKSLKSLLALLHRAIASRKPGLDAEVAAARARWHDLPHGAVFRE